MRDGRNRDEDNFNARSKKLLRNHICNKAIDSLCIKLLD